LSSFSHEPQNIIESTDINPSLQICKTNHYILMFFVNKIQDVITYTVMKVGWSVGFMVFNATFNYISAISWWSVPRRKPPRFITQCCIEYTSPWRGFELTTLVVIGTDCTCSCKSNYHTITTTTAPYIVTNINYCFSNVKKDKFCDWTYDDMICVINYLLDNIFVCFWQ
jgi:hypothetical protein